MLTLVIGGAASGKSEYAETLALQSKRPRIYLATMKTEPGDREGEARVARHLALRAGKDFVTVERPTAVEAAAVPADSCVLLEDLGNLAANEMFEPNGARENARGAIMRGIGGLVGRAGEVIVVSASLDVDGVSHSEETIRYLTLMSELNRDIAAAADRVVEVVCGIPVMIKEAAR